MIRYDKEDARGARDERCYRVGQDIDIPTQRGPSDDHHEILTGPVRAEVQGKASIGATLAWPFGMKRPEGDDGVVRSRRRFEDVQASQGSLLLVHEQERPRHADPFGQLPVQSDADVGVGGDLPSHITFYRSKRPPEDVCDREHADERQFEVGEVRVGQNKHR